MSFLAQPPIVAVFPWSRVHWFWGDERFVPHDHPDSNYGMTRAALLSKAPIPAGNVHPVPTEGLTPQQGAAAYEKTLREYYGAEVLDAARPLFDVTLLGIGDDGHTASLLPGQPALEETQRWVVAVPSGRSEPRITLTYPVARQQSRRCFPGGWSIGSSPSFKGRGAATARCRRAGLSRLAGFIGLSIRAAGWASNA